MDFVKMHGLGNDFIVVEGPYAPEADDITRWCERRTGVGADGILVATQLTRDRVSMRYWNADGGEAEMCGNGLRCVARYAHDRSWVASPEFTVETAVGDHPVQVTQRDVVAFVGEPSPFRTEVLNVGGEDVHPFAIGNPHAVLFVDDVDTAPVADIGSKIERDPLFPNRTNVEFVEIVEDERIRVRVWERGVGETNASGTGATAAAYVAHTIKKVPVPVEVSLPGGDLFVWFDEAGAWMRGPAEYSFEGTLR